MGSMAIGNLAEAIGDLAVAFGDDTKASEGQIVVGDKLFGEPIPEEVKNLVNENSQQIKWILAKVANFVVDQESLRRTENTMREAALKYCKAKGLDPNQTSIHPMRSEIMGHGGTVLHDVIREMRFIRCVLDSTVIL